MPRLPNRMATAALMLAAVFGLEFRAHAADAPAAAVPGEITFRNDVMAVLSKAGCNLGVCHGNATGKGGFKLSLRGEDIPGDLAVLTRELYGRRTNALRPAESLILLKATAQIAHEGGRRFGENSPEYAILSRWIARQMPADPTSIPKLMKLEVSPTNVVMIGENDEVQLKALATFSDGTQRDVTSMAVYEPASRTVSVSYSGMVERESMGETTVIVRYLDRQAPVRLAFIPERPDFAWREVAPANDIDRHVFAKLKTLRMNPSELASDATFLRRATLDVLGVPPTAGEVRAFLADSAPDKRAKLIEQLLERPEYADFWALKWSDLLKNEERALDRKGVQAFHHWIRQSIADNKPLDKFARELIAARGSTYTNPEANFYRANRDAVTRAEATAQVFLGIRLQCAKCHNHPFDKWSQDDYYDWAGFFARVDYRILTNNRRDKNDSHEFDGEQIVIMNRQGEMIDPRNGRATTPRFLGTATPSCKPGDDRLEVLADWITDPVRNPQFARMQVNRVWYHLLGRGIVDPIDDFRATNPSVNGALLAALTKDFIEHKYDLKYLVRTILSSRTYQLASEPNATNVADDSNFARAVVRPLSAEQLLDSISQATGVTLRFTGYPEGIRAGQLPGVAIRTRTGGTDGDEFLKLFGKPPRLLTCECERASETTLSQAFQLISGPAINGLLTEKENRISRLLASGKSNGEMIDELYLAALSRMPSDEERTVTVGLVDRAKDRRAVLEDVLWGMLNAKEFLLRQ
jgi:hypothetical protein